MIVRYWRGWTTLENADAYEEIVSGTVLPGIAARGLAGYHGAYLLRRELGDEVEFATVMLFDSLDHVRAFAGDDYDTAYVPPPARAVLSRFDERSAHYEALLLPEGTAGPFCNRTRASTMRRVESTSSGPSSTTRRRAHGRRTDLALVASVDHHLHQQPVVPAAAVGVALGAAHNADGAKAGLLVAADRRGVLRCRVDNHPVMTTLLDEQVDEQVD
jgi:hypothetical protein